MAKRLAPFFSPLPFTEAASAGAALIALVTLMSCSATSDDGADGSYDPNGAGNSGAGAASSGGGLNLGDGTGGEPGGGGGSGDEECAEDVDIVFVMDVSTSMDDFINKLADEILVVDQALAAEGLPNAPHYGLVVFVDDAQIQNSGAPYMGASQLRADFKSWASFTSSNDQVGGGDFNSSWPENSLDALYAAATSFQWRPSDSTLRAIIHTTDDTFWNGPSTENGIAIQHSYSETLGNLVQREIRVFAFAAHLGGESGTENVEAGWFTEYGGAPSLPEGTDGGVFNIDEVLTGQVSLASGITTAIQDSLCDPYTPIR